MASPIHSAAPTQITIHPAPEPSGTGGFFAGTGASINDVVDVINPLQHIPFANTLYRELTGDRIGAGATLAGGALFGGIFGFFAGLASVIFENATGKSTGAAVVAALNGKTPDPNIQLADNTVNLGDFSGDVRRKICTRNCTANDTLLAQAVPVTITPVPEIESPATVAELAPAASSPIDLKQREKDRELLALFGVSPSTASSAYQKADMRAYLKEASTNVVM